MCGNSLIALIGRNACITVLRANAAADGFAPPKAGTRGCPTLAQTRNWSECAAYLEFAGMPLDLFAGIQVSDYAAALHWYERLFGSPPSFVPNDTEAVWQLTEHGFVFIEQRPEHAGHARHLVFVEDLDVRVAQIAERKLEPAERETYANGVCKVAYRDPDGNEFGFGGAPQA